MPFTTPAPPPPPPNVPMVDIKTGLITSEWHAWLQQFMAWLKRTIP